MRGNTRGVELCQNCVQETGAIIGLQVSMFVGFRSRKEDGR